MITRIPFAQFPCNRPLTTAVIAPDAILHEELTLPETPGHSESRECGTKNLTHTSSVRSFACPSGTALRMTCTAARRCTICGFRIQ
jgi:hypothetical protein